MEADAELRAFLRRDEPLAPTGFVTRVISACRNNQELRNDGHCHPAPITTIEQLKDSSWHYWHNVGKKSVEHMRYLFEKNWERPTSPWNCVGVCSGWRGRARTIVRLRVCECLSSCRQAPLHGLHAAGVAAAGDDAEVTARLPERLLVNVGLGGCILNVGHPLGAHGRARP